MITKEEVKEIYDLVNIKIDDSELENVAHKFENVYRFASEIMSLDTEMSDDFEIVVEHDCPLREDVVEESISRDDALLNAGDKEYGYFRLKRVVK